MTLSKRLCRLLARFGIFPRGCDRHHPHIGADKATIKLTQPKG